MITGWKRRDNYWMSIVSPAFDRKLEFGVYLEIPRHGSFGLKGLKKNNLRMVWDYTSQSLRQEDATHSGFIVWGCTYILGGRGTPGIVQGVWESEAGEAGLDCRQSLLHETVCVLCRTEVPNDDRTRCCKGTEVGLAYGESVGQGIHAGAASTESCCSAWGNWDRRGILMERAYLSDCCKRPGKRTANLVRRCGSVSEESLDMFYQWLGQKKSKKIRLAVMDMWKAFTKSTKKNAPAAAILFNKFHVMRHLAEALDKVRKMEYARLSGKNRSYIKGQKYMLLSHKENLTLDGRKALKKLLRANKRLNTAYLLKESFGQLWCYHTEGWARRSLSSSLATRPFRFFPS